MTNNKITDRELEKMWDEFADIPLDEDECLEEDWMHWEKGTFREDIWHWFDEYHSNGVYWLLYERDRRER